MNILFPILFALIAAIGNAMFALGQKESAVLSNKLLYVSACALLAVVISPLSGHLHAGELVRNGKAVVMGGLGLFLTYLGFNLLYSRFGVTPYALYAVLSICTTTVVVGICILQEPINLYHKLAIATALLTVVLFSIGQSRP